MSSSRSVRQMRTAISPRLATRIFVKGGIASVFSLPVSIADQLTLARAAAVPVVIVLFVWDFPNHNYWATAVFAVAMATDWFDGRLARRSGQTSALGSLLDPVADKLLVLTVMIVLVGRDVFAGWMVAAIVARELLISGLRLAALERGVVLEARDLGRLKTWTQAVAVGLGGLAAAGAFDDSIARWALAVALALTWISGLDYFRLAPRLLRGAPAGGAASGASAPDSALSSSPASRQRLREGAARGSPSEPIASRRAARSSGLGSGVISTTTLYSLK